MANYVTNIVRFKGDENRIDELRASVQDERYGIIGIDFDKIIPMPKNLFMGAIGPMERELYGKNNWLDWSLANWGSKWNSMPTEDPDEEYEPGTLRFLTANNPPHPVLQKLSEMYPDITMEHQWADDNIGMGCGQRTYQAGKIIDEYCQTTAEGQSNLPARSPVKHRQTEDWYSMMRVPITSTSNSWREVCIYDHQKYYTRRSAADARSGSPHPARLRR